MNKNLIPFIDATMFCHEIKFNTKVGCFGHSSGPRSNGVCPHLGEPVCVCGWVWCGVVWCGVVWCGVCVCACVRAIIETEQDP